MLRIFQMQEIRKEKERKDGTKPRSHLLLRDPLHPLPQHPTEHLRQGRNISEDDVRLERERIEVPLHDELHLTLGVGLVLGTLHRDCIGKEWKARSEMA